MLAAGHEFHGSHPLASIQTQVHHSHPGVTLQEILSPLPAGHDSEDAHSLEASREEFR